MIRGHTQRLEQALVMAVLQCPMGSSEQRVSLAHQMRRKSDFQDFQRWNHHRAAYFQVSQIFRLHWHDYPFPCGYHAHPLA